jgi:hypothetical protein
MRRFAVPILLFVCAFLAQSQTTVFFEGFEGSFPSTNWVVGDLNANGEDAFWDDVDLSFGTPFPRSGEWMGYCAGVGFAGSRAAPYYQSFMHAVMERTVVLTDATSATLTFWFSIPSIEPFYDSCQVTLNGSPVWQRDTPTAGWEQATVNLNSYVGGPAVLSFRFVSDFDTEEEGWYLDDILVTMVNGVAARPPALAARFASNRIVISWPTNATGFSLQASETLPAATWLNVPTPPVAVGTNNVVTNNATGRAMFFRLRK